MVACFLNPGIEASDAEYLRTDQGRQILFDQMGGERDFPLQVPRWEKWFISRVGRVRLSKRDLVRSVAIFNVCAYASRDASILNRKRSIVADLPSAKIARRYLHDVLVPQAQRGERFLVICRGAWAWQISAIAASDHIAFANPRGGHFGAAIGNRISAWLEARDGS